MCHPWWRRWNRDRGSTLGLAHAPVLPPGSAVPVLSDTDARCDGPALLPPTAPVGSDFLWQRWPPRGCHPPTDVSPAPALLPYTGARSAQTTLRTASIPETVRGGFSRTWSGAESPDRSPIR